MLFILPRVVLLLTATAFNCLKYTNGESSVIINEYSFHGENLFIELKSEKTQQPLDDYYIAICDFAPLGGPGGKKATLNVRALIDLRGKENFH